tara:strand:- start:262 stop:438 length:177 start_codon:yes stop_codon:yes gene_type:complete
MSKLRFTITNGEIVFSKGKVSFRKSIKSSPSSPIKQNLQEVDKEKTIKKSVDKAGEEA